MSPPPLLLACHHRHCYEHATTIVVSIPPPLLSASHRHCCQHPTAIVVSIPPPLLLALLRRQHVIAAVVSTSPLYLSASDDH
eukprot:449482-Rhodomonas_salina.1